MMFVNSGWVARVHVTYHWSPSWNPAYTMACEIERFFGRVFRMEDSNEP